MFAGWTTFFVSWLICSAVAGVIMMVAAFAHSEWYYWFLLPLIEDWTEDFGWSKPMQRLVGALMTAFLLPFLAVYYLFLFLFWCGFSFAMFVKERMAERTLEKKEKDEE